MASARRPSLSGAQGRLSPLFHLPGAGGSHTFPNITSAAVFLIKNTTKSNLPLVEKTENKKGDKEENEN